jgi:hypothetical protein
MTGGFASHLFVRPNSSNSCKVPRIVMETKVAVTVLFTAGPIYSQG